MAESAENSERVPLRVILAGPETLRVAVSRTLTGDTVVHVVSEAALRTELQREPSDALLVDMSVLPEHVASFIRRVGRDQPACDVVVLAERGELRDAVDAVREGATDYLQLPLDPSLLEATLARTRDRVGLARELSQARTQLAEQVLGPLLIGRSAPMERLRRRIDRCARSDASVAIVGESGTGKEIVARMLHAGSVRAEGPFVALNCAAFPETLLEAELFGHERGAFTGAHKRRRGRFQAASGGTLFLDEVAEMSPGAQAKLLRVLQEGVVQPLGSDEEVRVDVRVISATHRDLRELSETGRFRADLMYRLKVLELRVPPLRDRMSDLPLLVEHFLVRFAFETPVPTLSTRAWAALRGYAFPGNVRELEHAIQHAVVLCDDDRIAVGHLPEAIAGEHATDDEPNTGFQTLAEALRQTEREVLIRALHLTEGKRTRAAELLGISRKSLWEKLRSHGLADHLR